MGRPREVLHLAFGTSSCHVASHLLNLQGVAATSTDGGDSDDIEGDPYGGHSSLCSPEITHASKPMRGGQSQSGRGRVYVPRALLVDYSDNDQDNCYNYGESDNAHHNDDPLDSVGSESVLYHGSATIEPLSRTAMDASGWAGDWDVYDRAGDENHRGAVISSHSAQRSDISHKRCRPSGTGLHAPEDDPWSALLKQEFAYDDRYGVAATAGDRGDSRWASSRSAAPPPPPSSRQYKSVAASSNQRHVDWDLEEEEDDDEDESEFEDDDYEKDYEKAQNAMRVRQQQQQLYQQRVRRQHEVHGTLDELWDRALFPSASSSTLPSVPNASSSGSNSNGANQSTNRPRSPTSRSSNVSWKTFYRLAPHAPDSILTAPSTASSSHNDNNSASALYETAEDRIRTLLEDCDSCQGAVFFTSNSSTSTSLARDAQRVLDFHRDECPSSRRLAVSLMRSHRQSHAPAQSAGRSPHEVARCHVRDGIQWSHLMENSTAVLPIVDDWSSSSDPTLTMASAMALACALEAATIPYRVRDHAATRRRYGAGLGINSGDGYSDNAPLPMSLASFLAAATPSPVHTVLELDAFTPLDDVASSDERQASASSTAEALSSSLPWQNQLLQGTSVERRRLSRSGAPSRSHQQNLEPGAWLQHASPRGLVKLWSPSGAASASAANSSDDRSHHQHFALLTSLRTTGTTASADPSIDAADDYVTCLMEGMGIRYRPEQAVGSVVARQSLNDVVKDSAVGTYWKALLKNKNTAASALPTSTIGTSDPPVLSVLGNSTRSHSFLSNLAAQMREVAAPGGRGPGGSTSFTSVRHGWFLRDVALGLLPEEDDCLEALSHCLDVRDRYRPPNRAHDDDDDDDQDGEDF
jgi:type II secretory pathway pseudopilin PulG